MLKVLFKCFSSFTEYLWEFFWIYDEFLVLNIFNKRKIYGIVENERKEVETNPNLVLNHFFASFLKHKSEVFPSPSKSKRTTTVPFIKTKSRSCKKNYCKTKTKAILQSKSKMKKWRKVYFMKSWEKSTVKNKRKIHHFCIFTSFNFNELA